jgi:hypothetical protein
MLPVGPDCAAATPDNASSKIPEHSTDTENSRAVSFTKHLTVELFIVTTAAFSRGFDRRATSHDKAQLWRCDGDMNDFVGG